MKIRQENEKLEHTYKTISFSNYNEFKIGWGFCVRPESNDVMYFVYN